MAEFKLSDNITITGLEGYDAENIPNQYKNGYYILNHKAKDREYLINPTIKYYLDKFASPKSQKAVLNEIQLELQNDNKELTKKCSSFFRFLCNRNILVPDKTETKPASRETLYKEGDILKGMEILKVISKSKYLDVYLAQDKKNGVQYVVKLLNKNKTLNNDIYLEEVEELENEYKLLDKVKNIPCITRAHSFIKNQKQAYIVIEYFESKSLSKFLKESPELTAKDALKITGDMLEAFSSIHENKLIHGDIHASNVLVNDKNEIKIIDLGMSFIVELENTEVTVFGGVNSYMPPERIRISSFKKYTKEPDFYSEVYQIGLLMYRIMYNTMPFKGFVWEELAKNIKEQEAEYPENSFTSFKVPEWLLTIIKKCLNKKPKQRYKSATEILKDYSTNISA